MSRVLNEKTKMVLLEGPKVCGNYQPSEALGMYEERMTFEEYDFCKAFLNWITKNKDHYGWGTMEAKIAEFLKTKEGKKWA